MGGVTYDYDANGKLTTRNVSAGTGINNHTLVYNESDQLQRLYDTNTGNEIARFSYDEHGHPVKAVSGDTIYTVMEYDTAGRLKKLQNLKPDSTLLNSFEYTYDALGNRKSETTTTGTRTFEYDNAGQLKDDGTYTYTYTPRGNRKSRTNKSTLAAEYYCYDAANQLLYVGSSTTPCSAAQNVSHDANGNMTQYVAGGVTWNYTYDPEDRLTSVKKNGVVVASFAYDARGRRSTKTAGGVTTAYHYDGFTNRVLYETDGTGAVVVWYNWAGDRLVSMKRGTDTYFYQYNGHGDVIALYKPDGTRANSYAYDVWGNPDLANTSETVQNDYRYAGYRWDKETGLYYLNARYYEPNLGRLITQDTFKGTTSEPWTQHLYAYAGNDPVNYVDPNGHFAMLIPLAWAGIAWLSVNMTDAAELTMDVADAVANPTCGQCWAAAGMDLLSMALPGPQAAMDGPTSAKLAKVRSELGVPKRGAPADKHTVAILHADGQEFWGISAHGQKVSYPVNNISKTHAETDALNQLANLREKTGQTGGAATLFVDRDPCMACGRNKGIRSGVRATGLDILKVVHPGGRFIVTPE